MKSHTLGLALSLLLPTLPAAAGWDHLGTLEYNLETDRYTDEIVATIQKDGFRRLDISRNEKSSTRSFANVLSRADTKREKCLGSGYQLQMNRGDEGRAEIITLQERIRVGTDYKAPCSDEIIRTVVFSVQFFSFKLVQLKEESMSLSSGDTHVLFDYDFENRKITIGEESAGSAMPERCNMEITKLNQTADYRRAAPLAGDRDCSSSTTFELTSEESSVIAKDLKIEKGGVSSPISCSSDGGEDRDAYSVEGIGGCQGGSDDGDLSDATVRQIIAALLRTNAPVSWEKQDSLGSNRFWMSISHVSCNKYKECWFEL